MPRPGMYKDALDATDAGPGEREWRGLCTGKTIAHDLGYMYIAVN